ncbi:hypothetical protein ACIRS1_06265 [Kitasatospora sp. NPDC101176]|uniref:hypothetical protein n=1 Tax=Kitasatospora sp. NPDC101176 TaxID=3364099 RepID=UPI003819C5F5
MNPPTPPSNPPSADAAEHGAALTERVVAAVRADPQRAVLDYDRFAGAWVEGEAQPLAAGVLETAVFPSGRPLPPSLRRWLAFDTGLLRRFGWFEEQDEDGDGAPVFAPRPLGELAVEEFGEGWGAFFAALSERFDECFLLPGGSDSRRVLATGTPDAHGEYPVFVLDVDDLPCIELMYPGLDVYLADTAGLLVRGADGEGYSALAADPVYGGRMREHARHYLDGELSEECLDRPADLTF